MDKAATKAAILTAISEEVDLWLDKESGIKDGYEYEDQLIKTVRNVGRIMSGKSLGTVPRSRNQKKTPHLLREIGGGQSASPEPAHPDVRNQRQTSGADLPAGARPGV